MTSYSLQVLCFLYFVLQLAAAACPAGYTATTNGCYKVYQLTRDVNQSEAQQLCRLDDVNSNLVSIRSIEDNDLYAGLFQYSTRIWIGLTREIPPHPVWRYISDGQPILNQGCYRYDPSYTDFKEMAPQSPPEGVTYQTCIDYCQSKTSSEYAYAAVTGTSGNFQCGCAAEDFSKDQQFDLGSYPSDPGCTELCDGDTNRCGNNGYMVVLKIGGSGFDQWAYGQTNNFDGYQTCGALITQHTPDKLGDEMYNQRFPYICQDKDHNFHVYEEYVTWFEARNKCRQTYQGGDLAKLRNNTDRDNLPALGADGYWLGLINTLWRWPNGDAVTWSQWESGKPDWKPYTCVSMDTYTKAWRDEDCSIGLRDFICETYAPPTTTVTVTSTTTTGSPATSIDASAVTTAYTATNTDNNTATTATDVITNSTANNQRALDLALPTSATTSIDSTVPTTALNTTISEAITSDDPTTPAYNTTNNATTAATNAVTNRTAEQLTTEPMTTTSKVTTTDNNGGTPFVGITTTQATAGSDPAAGASTGGSSGLSLLEIVLIVMCVLLLILIIILIILVIYFKKRNNSRNKIGYDGRAEAPIPNAEPLREEVYLPSEDADNTSTGSRTDLIKPNGFPSITRPLPHIKINGDVRQ